MSKSIALTFDDGPNPPFTDQLLDVLAKHKVKASFFVVGTNAKKNPDIVRRIAKEGHVVGPHSMDHRFGDYFRPDYLERQILPTVKLIKKITGQTPVFVRNPWLWPHPRLRSKLADRGMKLVRGTFGSKIEVFQPSAEWISKAAEGYAKPGRVLIFHDGYNAKGGRRDKTVAAIDLLIPRLKAEGYRLVTLAEL